MPGLTQHTRISPTETLLSESPEGDLESTQTKGRILKPHQEEILAKQNVVLAPQATLETLDQIVDRADQRLAQFARRGFKSPSHHHLDSVRHIYEAVISHYPQYENLGWVYYQLGRTFLVEHRAALAIEHLQKALNSQSRIAALKAFCYERLGYIAFFIDRDFRQALAFLKLATAIYPESDDPVWLASVFLLQARVLQAQGQTDRAVHSLQTAVATIPQHDQNQPAAAEIWRSAGELLSQIDGREREALRYLAQYLQSVSHLSDMTVAQARVYELAADMHFKLADYEAAANAYTTALELNPFHPLSASIYYRAAECFYWQGDYEAVITMVDRLLETGCLEMSPVADYRVYSILGNAQFALARYREAINSYQAALELASSSTKDVESIKLYQHFAYQLLGDK